MPTARVRAQAKVNLLLRVLARDESGFHALETVFHRLELADVVTVRATDGERTLRCEGPSCPAAGLGPAERNLAWRAAAAYGAATGWPLGFAIDIEKHIPVGGGLGGGSADGGAVLRALDAMAPEPMDPAALLRLAGSLGADVPFLTLDAPMALAWARGGRMLGLPALPPRDVVLACSDAGVSTADAYRWLDEERDASDARDAGETDAAEPVAFSLDELTSWRGIAALAWNDFERVVPARAEPVARALRALRADPDDLLELSLLAGSGATVFGVAREGARLTSERYVVTRTAARVEEVLVSG